MNPRELLEKRQPNWNELDQLCSRLASLGGRRSMTGTELTRFAALYRSACADLALAEAYHLPTSVVEHLQHLVARAHGLLYQGKHGHLEQAFRQIPRAVATDPYVHTAFVIFWVLFTVFCLLVKSNAIDGLAEAMVDPSMLEQAEASYSGQVERSAGGNLFMTGFYVWNNAGIGLMCFALGVWVLPGLAVLSSNAITLGTIFGYMMRDETGPAADNFQEFVMSHGPFELSAIILAAGAGLRIGMSWIDAGGLTRMSSLLIGARRSLPVLMLSVMLFLAAAGIEGLLSALNFGPSINLWFKGFISWLTCSSLMFYIVTIGLIQPLAEQEEDLDSLTKPGHQQLWI